VKRKNANKNIFDVFVNNTFVIKRLIAGLL